MGRELNAEASEGTEGNRSQVSVDVRMCLSHQCPVLSYPFNFRSTKFTSTPTVNRCPTLLICGSFSHC